MIKHTTLIIMANRNTKRKQKARRKEIARAKPHIKEHQANIKVRSR